MVPFTGSRWINFLKQLIGVGIQRTATRAVLVAILVVLSPATLAAQNRPPVLLAESGQPSIAGDRQHPPLKPFAYDLLNLAAVTHAFATDSARRPLADRHIDYGASILELAKLQEEVQDAARNLQNLNAEFGRRSLELRDLEAEKRRVEQRIAALRIREQTVRGDIRDVTVELAMLKQRKRELEAEITTIEETKEFVRSRRTRAKWDAMSRAEQAEYLIKYLHGEGDPDSFFPPEDE